MSLLDIPHPSGEIMSDDEKLRYIQQPSILIKVSSVEVN